MSADHHKFGLAPKGVSIVMYKNEELRRMQYFTLGSWSGGLYASVGMQGSKNAAPVGTRLFFYFKPAPGMPFATWEKKDTALNPKTLLEPAKN